MDFQGVTVEVGDHVAFVSKSIPLPHVEAVVMNVDDGVLNVLSTIIAPFRHGGYFPEDDVSNFEIVHKAEEAIPMQSRGKSFQKGQRIRTFIEGEATFCNAIAAFDGIVVGLRDDGETITGGAAYWAAAV